MPVGHSKDTAQQKLAKKDECVTVRFMKKYAFLKKYLLYILLIFVIVFLGVYGLWDKLTAKKLTESDKVKKAYLMGYNLGHTTNNIFKTKKEKKVFIRGFKHGLKGQKPLLNQGAIVPKGNTSQKRANNMKNKEEGQIFLKENAKKPNVKTRASGLQYKVLKEGQGQRPRAQDTVEVHYRGTLINGQEFDSSYKRNQTISFPLNGVIKGWTEGLQLMKEGAKYEFYIPSHLAYGERGAPSIPPHSVLIFEVELIKVK